MHAKTKQRRATIERHKYKLKLLFLYEKNLRKNMSMYSNILVQTEPVITDPREMQTIVQFSLRSLWGTLEPHSCQLSVSSAKNHDGQPGMMRLSCRTESVAAVRAALTLVTPPPYLESTIYRFDVVSVERSSMEQNEEETS